MRRMYVKMFGDVYLKGDKVELMVKVGESWVSIMMSKEHAREIGKYLKNAGDEDE